MLRRLETIEMKPVPATYTAAAAMSTGMLATMSVANGTAAVATGAENVYFVDKERIAKGIYASKTNLDDYFEQFVNVEEGEYVKLIPLVNGELFGTDQHAYTTVAAADTALKGKAVAANAGKIVAATSASRLMCEGAIADGDHVLLAIRVLDTAVSNS